MLDKNLKQNLKKKIDYIFLRGKCFSNMQFCKHCCLKLFCFMTYANLFLKSNLFFNTKNTFRKSCPIFNKIFKNSYFF